jgi:DNA-directed RNA polymerase subunit RPC12/RpoP
MTNEEILRTDDRLLTSVDKQRKFLLQQALQKLPCPNCGTQQNYFEAAGIYWKEWDFGRTPQTYRCVACGRGLIHDVYLTGGQGWGLIPVLPPIPNEEA